MGQAFLVPTGEGGEKISFSFDYKKRSKKKGGRVCDNFKSFLKK